MSKPKRWRMVPYKPSAQLVEDARGPLVGIGDYQQLEAENARLKTDVNELADALKLASEIGIKIADEVTRLKAQVETLTKAGDAMAAVCGWDFYDDSKAVELVNNWEASKEGRDNR